MQAPNTILEGIVSIEAAIKSQKRTIDIVYIQKEKVEKRDRKVMRFISLLKEENIEYTLYEREHIDSLAEGTSHGGVIAKASSRKLESFSDMISSLKNTEYLVMLDGVEDPFNFGSSIRNMFAFGCKGFIMPERNWMSAANVVAKSSAGASEMCELSIAPSDDELVKLLKEKGIEIVCSALSPTSVSLFEFRPEKPFVLFIGGEKRGISKTIFENADRVVHIPYANENAKYSLPTASCAAILPISYM